MVSINLSITVIVFVLFLSIIILSLFRKGKIPVKYAIVWLFAIMVMFIMVLIPNLLEKLANFLGFEFLSNMILCMFIGFLLFITLILTLMMAKQKEKTTLLIQEVSLLKKLVEDKK